MLAVFKLTNLLQPIAIQLCALPIAIWSSVALSGQLDISVMGCQIAIEHFIWSCPDTDTLLTPWAASLMCHQLSSVPLFSQCQLAGLSSIKDEPFLSPSISSCFTQLQIVLTHQTTQCFPWLKSAISSLTSAMWTESSEELANRSSSWMKELKLSWFATIDQSRMAEGPSSALNASKWPQLKGCATCILSMPGDSVKSWMTFKMPWKPLQDRSMMNLMTLNKVHLLHWKWSSFQDYSKLPSPSQDYQILQKEKTSDLLIVWPSVCFLVFVIVKPTEAARCDSAINAWLHKWVINGVIGYFKY